MFTAGGPHTSMFQNDVKTEMLDVRPEQIQRWPCTNDMCPDCEEHYRHQQDFFHQCMHYTRGVPVAEARQVTSKLSSQAKDGQRKLKECLERHGDLFMSRWRKRSKDKRAELLKRANDLLPDQRGVMYFDLTQSHGGNYDWKRCRQDKVRFAFLLPYLATETLKENPAFLFALLHHRSAYSLEDWATFDLHQFRDPWKTGNFDVQFSPMCVVVHGAKYGELVPFDGPAVHRGDIVGYPRARLLLEAQAELMKFLTRIMDLTLEGANLENPSSTKWTAMCNEGFRLSGDVAQWSSYSNQPFSTPPSLDIDAIISTAKLRFDASADHLALLQTDPAYMRRYIRITLQGSAYKNMPEDDVFHTVDAQICVELQSLYWWLCIKEEAEHVRNVRNRFRDQVYRGSPLPRPYDRALAALELVLVNYMIMRTDMYRNQMYQRPGFSKYFIHEYQGHGRATLRKNFEGSMPMMLAKDPLFWCLSNLCSEPDAKSNFDHASLFTFLEDHLARSSVEERARLDQILFDNFSDLAANHQLLLAVRLNRPQNKAGDGLEMKQTENRRAWKDRVIRAGHLSSSTSRGILLKRFFVAVAPSGRRDGSWVERHKDMHSLLSSYWSSIRNEPLDHMKDEEVARYLKADLEVEHQAQLEKESRNVLDEMSSRMVVPEMSRDMPAPAKSDKTKPAEKKAKPKTRPTLSDRAEQHSTTIMESSEAPIEATMTAKIPASKRAVTVFSRMFSPDVSETGQTCDWDQFVHAMKDVGFSARNSTGSAVVFELIDHGKIIFHRPHPVAKIDPVMLKAMGKRLSKWFGWARDTFVDVVGCGRETAS